MKRVLPSAFAVVAFAAALLEAGCRKPPENAPTAPTEVLVIEAAEANVPVFNEAIATLDGSTNTPIHAQVSGYLIKQAYQEGSVVKAGDLLFELDPKPFAADLDQAKAALAHAQAQELRAKQDLDRSAALLRTGALSQQEYQTQVQTYLSAQAGVAAAQASVTTAQINLSDTRITSPMNGVAGRAIHGLGDLLSPGTTLTTISTVDPIQADFTLPEPFYRANADWIAKVWEIPMADRPENIEIILADGTPYPGKGKIYEMNRRDQTSTGAITVSALFPNPDRVLRPGQFVKVHTVTQHINGAVLVPQRCVTQLQGINQLIVIKPDNTAEVRDVTLGNLVGSSRIITAGLKAGERVVVEGIQKCPPGGLVDPQPYEPPVSDPSATNVPPAPSSP